MIFKKQRNVQPKILATLQSVPSKSIIIIIVIKHLKIQ
jgi:hypothetical protein